jgi:succinate dehydrogenase/fumarate reductase flavoprotein subunit
MTTELLPRLVDRFDEVCDVLVIGFGFAGAAAAIEACDQGFDVLLIEKMDVPGGISATSGGGFRIARDSAEAFKYLQATNAGNTPDDVLQAIADGMTEMIPYFEALVEVNGARFRFADRRGSYDFPGHETFGIIEVESIPGFDAPRDWPHVQGGLGPNAFKLLLDNVNARDINVSLSTSALRLITSATGEVCGAWAQRADGRGAIKARHGVVLACGGFEASPEMQRQYWQIGPVMSAAFRGNTGDGIRMALDVGADLWHMWHFHGSYGFQHPDPDYPFAIRMKQLPTWTPRVHETDVKMAWILVDQSGRRFTNEYVPYVQDTGHRALDRVDTIELNYPCVPCYTIVDDVGRRLYPLGKPNINDTAVTPYEWSADNEKEVALGILKRADTIADLSGEIGCDEAALQETISRWNRACRAGHDGEFSRPPASMVPIEKPPFLVGEIWPLVSNTQGGPVHDARQRVLNTFGDPIPRLYEAGELGSIWGWLYMSGANLTECLITGRTAARELASLETWDVTAS